MGSKIQELDTDIQYLLDELKEHSLSDVNLIILSDHGFASVNGTVFLEDCITTDTYNLTDNSPMMNIWPVDNSEGRHLCIVDNFIIIAS